MSQTVERFSHSHRIIIEQEMKRKAKNARLRKLARVSRQWSRKTNAEQYAAMRKKKEADRETDKRERDYRNECARIARKQRAPKPLQIYSDMVNRKDFRDLYGQIVGGFVDIDSLLERKDITNFFRFLLECFQLHRTYGKFFNYFEAQCIYESNKKDRILPLGKLLESLADKTVDFKSLRLNRMPHLTNTERRKIKMKLATPTWRDQEKIDKIYKDRDRISNKEGVMYHVDHVIPIAGHRVCGLHVHQNLRVILGTDNLKKSNRFNVDRI